MLKLSLYKSLLTNKRTMLVASIGKCGYTDYRETQIYYCGNTNRFYWTITDGYKSLRHGWNPNLKSVLNITEGYMKQL